MRNSPCCRAVIFDMDGVLIDSEPFWQSAEQEIFETVGLSLAAADMARTIGLRIEEVTDFWFQRSPWTGPAPGELAVTIVDRVIELVHKEGRTLPGVRQAVGTVRELGIPLAVASSSPRRLIRAVLEQLGFESVFDHVVSAEDEAYGKPHPAVFLTAAAALGVAPGECLVIEDSLNGIVAAKAARMTCLAVPDPRQRDDPRLVLADRVYETLEALDAAGWGRWLVARS